MSPVGAAWWSRLLSVVNLTPIGTGWRMTRLSERFGSFRQPRGAKPRLPGTRHPATPTPGTSQIGMFATAGEDACYLTSKEYLADLAFAFRLRGQQVEGANTGGRQEWRLRARARHRDQHPTSSHFHSITKSHGSGDPCGDAANRVRRSDLLGRCPPTWKSRWF